MIVQGQDGKFYVNPIMWGDGWVVRLQENVELRYKSNKKVSWKTCRKVLKPAGIGAQLVAGPYTDRDIYEGQMHPCTAYIIRLTHPIPVPNYSEQVLDSEPAGGDFEIIRFDGRNRRKE